MRTALISLLILAASVGCGKASETAFESCTEVCTRHHANLDPESCSGYTNDEVDGCVTQCEHYVDVAGEDYSEDVQAFLDDIGGRQLSCVWWEDCRRIRRYRDGARHASHRCMTRVPKPRR